MSTEYLNIRCVEQQTGTYKKLSRAHIDGLETLDIPKVSSVLSFTVAGNAGVSFTVDGNAGMSHACCNSGVGFKVHGNGSNT